MIQAWQTPGEKIDFDIFNSDDSKVVTIVKNLAAETTLCLLTTNCTSPLHAAAEWRAHGKMHFINYRVRYTALTYTYSPSL